MLTNLFGGRGHVPGDAERFPAIGEVRNYWQALRRDGGVPARAAVDPRGIAGALDCAFVLERVAPRIARFRIAGMHLCDLAGMDLRGVPALTLFAPDHRAAFGDVLEQVFAGPACLDLALEAERGAGRPELAARMLVLPLAGETGSIGMALGCLATAGGVGRAPRRFAIARRVVTPLEPPRPEPVRLPEPGFAEPPAPPPGTPTGRPTGAPPGMPPGMPQPAPRAQPGRGHLRLVRLD
jgi:hypothetical protein